MAGITAKEFSCMGNAVHYLEAGPNEGQAVLMLHGMKFKARTWQDLGTIDLLAEAGYRVIALDLPGFGNSPAGEATPDDVLVEAVAALNLGKPVLVGPSMGGRVSLEFALDHQELVGGLVLIGAVGVEENKSRLSSLTMPVQIVWGGEDAISPLVNGELLAKEIDSAAFTVLDGAPHPCYLDQPQAWHDLLISFLKERF